MRKSINPDRITTRSVKKCSTSKSENQMTRTSWPRLSKNVDHETSPQKKIKTNPSLKETKNDPIPSDQDVKDGYYDAIKQKDQDDDYYKIMQECDESFFMRLKYDKCVKELTLKFNW